MKHLTKQETVEALKELFDYEYQGCEYVVMQSHWKKHGTMIHKGNCRFCKERRQKEMEELVIKLKEK